MKIGNVDLEKKTFVMAEIGNNHNGDFTTAKRLIEAAADAGADGVKFQTFEPELYVHKDLSVVAHAKGVHKTQIERLKSIKMSDEQYEKLSNLAQKLGLVFMSTPFDLKSVDFLDQMVPAFKIASGDLTNIPLLKKIAEKKKKIIISTGMAEENEIEAAVNILGKHNVVLLHCVAIYPTPNHRSNLLSIPYLRKTFGIPIGYSDHTTGIHACQTAVALGAVLIEKHFTLDKKQPLGDHVLSAEPDEMAELVETVKVIRESLGKYGKKISEEELKSRGTMRRGLYAKTNIAKGTRINHDMVVALRPPVGVPVDRIDEVLGKKTVLPIAAWSAIDMKMLEN